MPRDLPVGNGSLLVAFDRTYRIRDLYWPHVGTENHAGGHVFHLGVWVAPGGDRGRAAFRWLDQSWERDLVYEHETLVTQVRLSHPDLPLSLEVSDAVDFHEDLLVRRFRVHAKAEEELEVRLFLHHDFHIYGHEVGDTAYYEPARRAVLHYKARRWFLINGAVLEPAGAEWEPSEDSAPGLVVGLHQWACGHKEIPGREGTWRDAEDGLLSGNPVAQGSVDSVGGLQLTVPPGEARTAYAWLAVGESFDHVIVLNRMVRQRGPESFRQRTHHYWHLWLTSHRPDFTGLPEDLCHQYLTSLLVIRTQIDDRGGILAANDTDIGSAVRDTYSYVWPRDGALVAYALVRAGYIDLPRNFFRFCARVIGPQGYFLHKYNPDGSLASSWHPWVREGKKEVPIQEDETALVLWALWEHFDRYRDVEFIKPLYRELICPAADFLTGYREAGSGLPRPSYDLWEERYGIFAWTVGATWAGLRAGAKFAAAFGEAEREERYRRAAEEIREATEEHLWDPQAGRYLRGLLPGSQGGWQRDDAPDASMVGLWKFGMLPPAGERMRRTMEALRRRLWVRTEVGGMARYQGDAYHRVSGDAEKVPGNPWYICTLWLAQWLLATAERASELAEPLQLLQWVRDRALPSGILAEQLHPHTAEPLSVSPLTWSHSTYVSTVHDYLDRYRAFTAD